MSTSATEQPDEQTRLFGQAELAPVPPPPATKTLPSAPRLLHAQRDQVELRACDLESMLAHDHPARAVWAFVQSLDLQPLYAQVRSVEGRAGAPAIDPAILMALWLWATVDGVGSAREVARLCERDDAYRWVCGGVGVNHHTLSDFRCGHGAWLDEQLTRSITVLLRKKLVTLDVVAQDGLRVRAAAKAASFRRHSRLQELHEQARGQVRALKEELDGDAAASTRRKQAARERTAREREQRVAQALDTLRDIEKQACDRAVHKAAQRKAKGHSQRNRNDEPPSHAPSSSAEAAPAQPDAASPASQDPPEQKKDEKEDEKKPRASTTDSQARVMKMADGGFRPAYNVQLAVDEASQLIAAVQVVNDGTDMHLMSPLHAQVIQRYGRVPQFWLADGGYSKHQAIEELSLRGSQPVVPPARSRTKTFDPLAVKPSDTAPLVQWRRFMASDQGKALYLRRGASVECANAQLRRRGLDRFNVRGQIKAYAVTLWHALAHNLMRMRSLGFSFA